jgi:tetratricopeptide (TPR) repeat protein
MEQLDPTNPVVALCADGMAAELRGEFGTALRLFEQAWAASTDDYERCVSAHYVARHQDGPASTLEWNQRSLRLALSVGDERVSGFFPSLYLNIGRSHEELGDLAAARASYQQASAVLGRLNDDAYGDMLRDGITRALLRTEGVDDHDNR